jgi:hypothetical protein
MKTARTTSTYEAREPVDFAGGVAYQSPGEKAFENGARPVGARRESEEYHTAYAAEIARAWQNIDLTAFDWAAGVARYGESRRADDLCLQQWRFRGDFQPPGV